MDKEAHGHSLEGHKESDMTVHKHAPYLSFSIRLHTIYHKTNLEILSEP